MAVDIRRMNLSKKLYLIYSLNVVDWVCTIILLVTGRFFEANPISRMFIGSIPLGFVMKCIVPLLIIFTVMLMMRFLDFHELYYADCFISFTLTFYIAILVDHMLNFVILALGG